MGTLACPSHSAMETPKLPMTPEAMDRLTKLHYEVDDQTEFMEEVGKYVHIYSPTPKISPGLVVHFTFGNALRSAEAKDIRSINGRYQYVKEGHPAYALWHMPIISKESEAAREWIHKQKEEEEAGIKWLKEYEQEYELRQKEYEAREMEEELALLQAREMQKEQELLQK